MDLYLIRLARGPDSLPQDPSPEIVADIVWANARPDDDLKHLRARPGPVAGTVDIALFHTASDHPTSLRAPDDAGRALTLCRRAIGTSPALTAWTAHHLPAMHTGWPA